MVRYMYWWGKVWILDTLPTAMKNSMYSSEFLVTFLRLVFIITYSGKHSTKYHKVFVTYMLWTRTYVFTVMKIAVLFTVSQQNVPISLGRCGCSCIQSFRCSTASLTRCSFKPNSLHTFSSNSLLGGSITSKDISYLATIVIWNIIILFVIYLTCTMINYCYKTTQMH